MILLSRHVSVCTAILVLGLSWPAWSLDDNCLSDARLTATPLDILLTNDDGYDQPGIVALHRALTEAGHRVLLAAPARNASGSSTSLTLAPIAVRQIEANIYAVQASPATAVLLAVSALFPDGPPDLVISGINKGANLGPATPVSGTVGATVAAALIARPPIPGIAVSTDPLTESETTPENLQHLADTAQFVVRLVARLQQANCTGALLPRGVALNVNYPPVPRKAVKGLKLTHQGKGALFSLVYERAEDDGDTFMPDFTILPQNDDRGDGDTGAFDAGYITIVPIDADFTADQATRRSLGKALGSLSP